MRLNQLTADLKAIDNAIQKQAFSSIKSSCNKFVVADPNALHTSIIAKSSKWSQLIRPAARSTTQFNNSTSNFNTCDPYKLNTDKEGVTSSDSNIFSFKGPKNDHFKTYMHSIKAKPPVFLSAKRFEKSRSPQGLAIRIYSEKPYGRKYQFLKQKDH